MADKIDVQSPFCAACTEPCCPDAGRGCPAWRRWFIDRWNQKITTKKPKTREFFRYEHQDIVRENMKNKEES